MQSRGQVFDLFLKNDQKPVPSIFLFWNNDSIVIYTAIL